MIPTKRAQPRPTLTPIPARRIATQHQAIEALEGANHDHDHAGEDGKAVSHAAGVDAARLAKVLDDLTLAVPADRRNEITERRQRVTQ
jgi:hypothetical protein